MRKSFIVHNDSLGVLDDLSDEQCGELFRAIRAYQLGESIDLSPIVKIAFSPFKNQFDRDDIKYEKTCIARADAGSKGGKKKAANVASASKCKQEVAKLADSVSKSKSKSKSESESESDSDKDKTLDQSSLDHEFEIVWSAYGKKGNKKTSLRKFSKLGRATRQDILNHIPVYVLSTPDKQYRKNFETYFNQEAWKDEVITNAENKPNRDAGGHRLSTVERVRATNETNRAARADNRDNLGDADGCLRQYSGESIRGSDAGSMDSVIEGDYIESD